MFKELDLQSKILGNFGLGLADGVSELSDEELNEDNSNDDDGDGDDDDGDGDDDDDDGEDEEMTAQEKDDKVQNIVPPLPAEEWGQKGPTEIVRKLKSETKPSTPTAEQPVKMRPPIFAKQQYDGVVSDSDESEDEADLPPPGTLGRKIAEMKWGKGEDGSAKIEEIDEEDAEEARRTDKLGWDDGFDEAMRKRILGEDSFMPKSRGKKAIDDDVSMRMDVEPDMEEEFENFLTFSRDALGIDDAMWDSIVQNRESRGGEQCFSSSLYQADRSSICAEANEKGPRQSRCLPCSVCQIKGQIRTCC